MTPEHIFATLLDGHASTVTVVTMARELFPNNLFARGAWLYAYWREEDDRKTWKERS